MTRRVREWALRSFLERLKRMRADIVVGEVFPDYGWSWPSDVLHQRHRATGTNLEGQSRSVRLAALGLRPDPHGSVMQIHHEELEGGEKERPSAFPKIMLKQTDSGIQQLHGASDRTQDQQRRRRLLVDCPQYEQSQRNSGRRRVHGQ